MAAKRQSFLDKLERELPEPPKSATDSESKVRSTSPLSRPDIHKTTLYVPDAVHERLREIAFTERCKVHDLFMEGIDLLIESRGHPERTTDKKMV